MPASIMPESGLGFIMRLGQNSILLLLILSAAHAMAEPGHGRGSREAVRAFHVQNTSMERDEAASRQFGGARAERRLRNDSFFGSSGDGRDAPAPELSMEAPRRQGRLTPEERRALRRQIDEVGHDLYVPKR